MKPVISTIILAVALAPTHLFAKTISVPFTLQSPYSIWKQPWEDACEEAVTVMVDQYYNGFNGARLPKAKAAASIKGIVNLENNYFGFNKDTNADQIIELVNNFFFWETFRVDDPSLDQIKAEIDNGRPVIAPVYGRGLKNRSFRAGGPDYHTVVIKGYDDAREEFIVQEPGVGIGLDYHYTYATIMDALHDFVPNNKTSTGKKVAIFTRHELLDTGKTDGDKDGLKKADEQLYGTDLRSADTDHDEFTDGEEVRNGYSPTVNEQQLPDGALVKTAAEPVVYFLFSGSKFPIQDEQVFVRNGWEWQNIKVVSHKFLDHFSLGNTIR